MFAVLLAAILAYGNPNVPTFEYPPQETHVDGAVVVFLNVTSGYTWKFTKISEKSTIILWGTADRERPDHAAQQEFVFKALAKGNVEVEFTLEKNRVPYQKVTVEVKVK